MNSKIVIKQSSIHINDYELGDCKKLEYMFSVYDQLYRTYYPKGIHYIEEEKKLIVPRGIDIFYLERLFGREATIDRQHDPFDRINGMHIRYAPRDNVQKEALAFMNGEGKYTYTKAKSQLSLNLNTGKGKSYCSIVNSVHNRVRSMIITSSIGWLEQWRDYIVEYTDTKPSEIYMLVGSPSIHRLLKRDASRYKFILASHDTIKSFGDTHGWDKITELFKHTKIAFKYYDEAHLNFDNMTKIDAYTNTFKTFYVTATPARSDADENVIFKYYFKNVPSVDLFDEDTDPHTNYLAIRYNSHPSPIDINDCKNGYGFDKNKYSSYIVNRPNYYKLLRILLDIAMRNGKKNVFYIATNSAIATTKKWIEDNYPELYGKVGVYTSVVTENKQEQLDKPIILSTTKSLGAAMDIKGLKMVVVLAEPFKSEVIARQTLGRTRDDDTYYVEVVDDGFKSIRDYYKYKQPIFDRYACSVSEMKLTDRDIDERIAKILLNRGIIPVRFVPIGTLYETVRFHREEIPMINPVRFKGC